MNEIGSKQDMPGTSAWDSVEPVPITHHDMSILVPTPIKMTPQMNMVEHPSHQHHNVVPIMPQTPHVSSLIISDYYYSFRENSLIFLELSCLLTLLLLPS